MYVRQSVFYRETRSDSTPCETLQFRAKTTVRSVEHQPWRGKLETIRSLNNTERSAERTLLLYRPNRWGIDRRPLRRRKSPAC